MEDILSCVVCLAKCKHVGEMKQHMTSREHTQRMSQVFQKVFFHFPGFFPEIMEWVLRRNFDSPVLGLSLLTLCFSPELYSVFYLCHACEQKVPPDTVYLHMYSEDHVRNYYNFTDPNRLFFSWLPHVNTRMNAEMKREARQCSRSMQLLDLPKEMWLQFQNLTFIDVMAHITEKLPNHIKALSLPRVEIEAYLKDAKRRSPLLGMQHIVECTTAGGTKKCYLCTLCKLSFPNQLIIKHVLSFDHVFSYFVAWHPCSMKPKEFYIQKKAALKKVLHLAKEEVDAHGCGQMRQLRLEPEDFQSVNFSSYDQALAKLESFAKERHEPSLVVNIIPLNKLAPPRETAGALCEERFPLLGLQFIVKYYVSNLDRGARFACLLCKMKVANSAWRSHVISREHVASFLESFHPGSVDVSMTEVALLDLAKQSMAFHPTAEIQEVSLSRPIFEVDKLDFPKLLHILKANKSCLSPPIIPQVKLVPRTSGKTENTNYISESTTEKTDQSCPVRLNIEGESITSVSTNEDLYQKESKSEPQGQADVLVEEMGQGNEVMLQKELPVGQQNKGAMNTSPTMEKQKQSEKMTSRSPDTWDSQLRRLSGCEGSPDESSKGEAELKQPGLAFETSSEDLRNRVHKASPVFAFHEGDFSKPPDISDCSSQKNMVNDRHCAEEFDGKIQQVVSWPLMSAAEKHPKPSHLGLNRNEVPLEQEAETAGRSSICPTEPERGVEPSLLQEPVYWSDTPTSQYRSPPVLGSPSAASTLNPNAAACPTGTTNLKNVAALAFMSDTHHSNVEEAPQVSANPQIPLPRTIRTTERSLSTDHSRPAGRRSNKEKRPPRVGLSYIITVVCGEKQQVYCQLCSIRLNHSTHLSSLEHQRKYVKKRFPHWDARAADETELAKMANKLVDMDKGLSDQKIKVEFEMYQSLAVLPEGKAILALREILNARGKRNSISVAACSDDVSSPRIPSAKDGGHKTPGRMPQQSSSNHSLTMDGQRCVEGSEHWKPLKAVEKSSAGLCSPNQTVVRCSQKPYDASEMHTRLIKESLNPKEASGSPPGFCTVHQSSLMDHQKPGEAPGNTPAGLTIAEHSLLKDSQKLHEAQKKSGGLPSVACAPRDEKSSLGISSSNQNLLMDIQKAAEKSPSGFSSTEHNSRIDGQKPHEASEKSLSGSSAISRRPHDGPVKSLPSCSSANQSLIKDHQKPQKSHEKSSVGFSGNCQSLLQSSLKPHESCESAPPGFSGIDQSLLQGGPKHRDISSADRKPNEAPGKSPEGLTTANQTLVKDTQRLHEMFPPGIYTVHWKPHEADQVPLVYTASQSFKKNGQKPLEAPEISPTGDGIPGEHFPLLQPGQSEQQIPIEPGKSGSERAMGVAPKDLLSLLKKNDVQDIVGLALIWECQVTSDSTGSPPLYLCESCTKTMLFEGLCQHLVSVEHQLKYLLREYPVLMNFWFMEDLRPWMKEEILRDVAHFLAVREQHFKKDAKRIHLSQALYNKIKGEPFSNALKIIQHCKNTSSA